MRNILLCTMIFLWGLLPRIYSQPIPFKKMSLPEVLKSSHSVELITDSLKSTDEWMRIYAAVRLGELQDPAAIHSLEEAYAREPAFNTIDHGYGLKYYCLRSIGLIGGSEAARFLNKTWDDLFSSKLGEKDRYLGEDVIGNYKGLFEGMEALDEPGYSGLLQLFFSNNGLHSILRELACRSYLRIYLKDARFATFQDSLVYLLREKMSAASIPRYDENGNRTTASIKDSALYGLIITVGQQDPDAIRSFASALPPSDPFVAQLDTLYERAYNMMIRQKGKE